MHRTIHGALVLILVLEAMPAAAQFGGVVIRPNDGAATRCVDGRKDEVWMTMRRLVTTKSKQWFTVNTSVSVLINATVRSAQQAGGAPAEKPVSFPLMEDASFANAPNGLVSVPLEYTIIDSLKLVQDKRRLSGITIDLTLINQNSKNGWGTALATLDSVAKKLPLPSNPFVSAGSYLLELANTSVAADVKQQSPNTAPKTASIDLKFDPSGTCPPDQDFQTTGTLAVLMDTGSNGFIPVANASGYCWTADLQPVFVLKAGKKKFTGASCTNSNNHEPFADVANNYVGFVLSALPATADLAGAPQTDLDAARGHCAANGLTSRACGVR